ncbi:MAG: class I SAM-dependent methyltransferase [Candidatus Dormibacteria bacterium]
MSVTEGGAMWDRRYTEHVWTTEPDPLVVEMAGPLAVGHAVDLGCGTGRHAIWLAQRGWTVTGVDASAVGLQQAAARAASLGIDLTLVQADLADYRPPAKGFDLVLLANVHPTAEQRAATLAQAARAVAPGGRLLIIGHHLDNLGRTGPPDPGRLYTVERLREALPTGMTVEVLERFDSRPGGPAGSRPDPAVVAMLVRSATN